MNTRRNILTGIFVLAAVVPGIANVTGETVSAADRPLKRVLSKPVLVNKPQTFPPASLAVQTGSNDDADAWKRFATVSFTDDRLKHELPPCGRYPDDCGFPAEGGSGGARKKAKK